MYILNVVDCLDSEKSWSQLDYLALQEILMRLIPEAMADMLMQMYWS